ncbi:TLC domain-containing protein [Schizophyllum amplum]|uniref:TLC domain-containing protein n=1 Tax=Schizophyllum amplum TaxID=97359 RepID=A0A550CTE1_9AGAR|nr:TLC domain-containing protein [Auriculariopsis ampla]
MVAPFISLSYPIDTPKSPDSFPDSRYYETGPLDLCFMVTVIAVMAVLRDVCRIYVFEPFAEWKLKKDLNTRWEGKKRRAATNGSANGVGNGHVSTYAQEERHMKRSVMRFAEQGWSVVYYTCQWSYGFYVHLNLPTQLSDLSVLWTGYPHIPIAAPVKFYYLTEIAFYIHQLLIINAEARRKDHWQMFTHHIITIFLMMASYYTNFTRVGCIIMVLMDWCDIWLPAAKMGRYLDIPHQIYDYTFAFFLVSWFVTRHVLFVCVLWSTWTGLPANINFEWTPEKGHYITHTFWLVFVSSLAALQVLQCMWFFIAMRVAYRVVFQGDAASDDRSDEEE